jgi:hypothetical protein
MTSASILLIVGALAICAYLGFLALAALILTRRRGGRDVSKEEMKNPGPVALVFKWTAIVSLVSTVVSLIALFTIQSISFAWISVLTLILFLVTGPLYRVLLLAGK